MKLIALVLVVLLVVIAVRVVSGGAAGVNRRRLGLLYCRFAGHRRRPQSVRKVGTTYHSRCRSCGVRMVRERREGDWVVADPLAGDGVP